MSQQTEAIKPVDIRFTFEYVGKGHYRHGFSDVPTFGSAGGTDDMVTFRILGDQFSGKSALLEAICSQYLNNRSTIYDIFASNDNEGLAWLDSPYKDKIVLFHGNDIEVTTKPGFPEVKTMKIADLHPQTAPEGRIFLTSREFYRKSDDDAHFYHALFRLTKRFRERTMFVRPDGSKRTDVIAIREADEFLESQRQGQTKAQSDAEAQFAKFHNQMVHHGFALVMDQHRDVDVAKKIRYLANYLMFKNMGNIEIPRPWWPLAGLDPDRMLRKLKPQQFCVVTNKQKVGGGVNDFPPWHIDRGVDLLEKHGIRVIDTWTGAPMKEEEPKGAGKGHSLSTDQKSRIIQLFNRGWTQAAIAQDMNISPGPVNKVVSDLRASMRPTD